MGVGVVLITAVVVTVFPTNAGLAGLALTSALNLTGFLSLQLPLNLSLDGMTAKHFEKAALAI